MSRLIRLYPPRWRARYETEFRALLDEHQPDLRDRLDILRGAVLAWLNPRYGRSLRRSAFWLSLVAAITVVAPAAGVLRSSPVEASPRYPVTLDYGPDREVNTLQFVVSGVRHTVPHLILSLDAHRSWLLTGVITERSPVGGPLRVVPASTVDASTWRHTWDFGRVEPGQRVRLTVDYIILRPAAFAYSINGYGALTAGGRPDANAPLTTPRAQDDGTLSFGTVGPERYPYRFYQVATGCDVPRNGYHLCDIGDAGLDFAKLDFRNAGPAIPHFVLRVDSRHSWSVEGLSASTRNNTVPRLLTPRILSVHGSTWILDFGRLPHGAFLHVRLAITPVGRSKPGGELSAFGNLTPAGQPDPKSLLFRNWRLFG